MALAPSRTYIKLVNRALSELGLAKINAFDDGSQAANIAADIWVDLVLQVISGFNWPSCLKWVTLPNIVADDIHAKRGLNAYQLPAIELRVAITNPDRIPYVIETQESGAIGRILYTTYLANQFDVQIVYAPDDPSTLEADLSDAIMLRLASRLARPLGKSDKLPEIQNEYLVVETRAKRLYGIDRQNLPTKTPFWDQQSFTGGPESHR